MEHGGKRIGAGRKPGQLEQKTIERIHVKKAFDGRVMCHADELFNAQFSLAVGSTYIYRVQEKPLKNGETKKEHILVTDPDEIKLVLDGADGESSKIGKDYYIITTAAPDSRAIDSLLDRTFGKAQQSVKIEDEGDDADANLKRRREMDLMFSLDTIKELMSLHGFTFEAAVRDFFSEIMPEFDYLRETVVERLSSEMVS